MITEHEAEPLPKIYLPAIWFVSEILPLEILLSESGRFFVSWKCPLIVKMPLKEAFVYIQLENYKYS